MNYAITLSLISGTVTASVSAAVSLICKGLRSRRANEEIRRDEFLACCEPMYGDMRNLFPTRNPASIDAAWKRTALRQSKSLEEYLYRVQNEMPPYRYTQNPVMATVLCELLNSEEAPVAAPAWPYRLPKPPTEAEAFGLK